MLGWARAMVAFVPMRHWQRHVGNHDATAVNPADEASIASVSRAIKRVGRNSPVHFVCLPQALAARWMLRRRGIASALFIGTHKFARREEPHKFHAWLKIGERWVTGRCNEQDYAVFC